MLPSSRGSFARCRINVDTAELLAALPAPGATASSTNYKSPILCLEPTSKNVITGVILQAPPLAPRTLFRII